MTRPPSLARPTPRCRLAWLALGTLGRRTGLVAVLALASATSATAWSGHTLCTWEALAALPTVGSQVVRAESLERFVAAQASQLERLLDEQEAWARTNVPDYPPRPDELAFRAAAGSDAPPSHERFVIALRMNPFAPRPLYLQLRPDAPDPVGGLLPVTAVATLPAGMAARQNRYVQVTDGEAVGALDVVATAANEPDYGLDLGLYADNGTAYGLRMGLGRQPYGNPALDYASQAPLHMGFHHEARLVNVAVGDLRRTMIDSRIALFSALARHAFASGHPYWGWRFTGWALHYVQDLTQPYHATALPGVGLARLLFVSLADLLGFEGPKRAAIALVSNRHLVLETYQHKRMLRAMASGQKDDALLAALRDARDDAGHWRYETASTRRMVSREAHDSAAALDAQVERSFPPRLVDDPKVTLGVAAELLEMEDIARQGPAAEHAALEEQVASLLRRLGRHSRALVRAVAPLTQGEP